MAISLPHRFYILAWTSLWIYVPAIVWFIRRQLPFLDCLMLLVSGTASILHWTKNKSNDWRHITDLVSAVILAVSLTYRLLQRHRFIVCSVLSGGLVVFFALQRFAQRKGLQDVNWTLVTTLHVIFRYIGFWLAMAVHLPFDWTVSSYSLLVVLLTTFYVLHIVWLSRRFSSLKMVVH